LTSITIPNSVTTIHDHAFSGCECLNSVTIPISVTSIGWWAFSDCTRIKSIYISGSVFEIGHWAFLNCSAMFTVDGGNTNYSSMDGVLFNKNQTILVHFPTSKKGSYSIPKTVTSIVDRAFGECRNLTSIVIHNKVNSIDGCFSGCSAVFSVDKENPNYSGLDGVLFDKNQTVLIQCSTSRTGSYSMPNTVISISGSAFEKCIGLTSIIIPESVTTIGGSCFNYCSGLTSITVKSSTPVELRPFVSVFYKIDKKSCKLYVPAGSKSLYQAANQWKDFENIVETNLN